MFVSFRKVKTSAVINPYALHRVRLNEKLVSASMLCVLLAPNVWHVYFVSPHQCAFDLRDSGKIINYSVI